MPSGGLGIWQGMPAIIVLCYVERQESRNFLLLFLSQLIEIENNIHASRVSNGARTSSSMHPTRAAAINSRSS
jgi:hypothetical protein